MEYKPRRASARWMEDAPEYILSVHDNKGRTFDRYTVFFGGTLLEPSLLKKRMVYYLGMSHNPTHPQGFSMWGEGGAWNRDASGRKIRWLDLPVHVREHVISRVARALED